jgi:hypothetical protein
MPNGDVFKVQDAWGKILTSEGRTGVHTDNYGNVIYDNSTGGQNIIEPGWKAAQELAAYQQQKATAAAPPAGGGGGGYSAPRSNGYSPPRGGSGGGGNAPPAASNPIFDSQAHRNAFADNANASGARAQRSIVDSVFGSGDPNGGPPSGSYTPPAPYNIANDPAGAFASNVVQGGVDLAQGAGNVLGAGVRTAGNVLGGVGNAILGNNMPDQAEAMPVGAAPQAVASLPDWYRAAQQKGFLP